MQPSWTYLLFIDKIRFIQA